MSFKIPGFAENEVEYYSRQMVMKDFGVEGQGRLKRAKVCVVGLGGLGSPVSIQLASMGVGHLRLVDRDVVDISNLHRQHLYGVDVIGYPKVEAAAERLNKLNPYITVEPMPLSVTPSNAEDIIKGMDLVVDCLDSMAPRYSLNRACIRLGIPLIHGAVITQIGNATTIIPGETVCLECFQGGLDDEALPSCAIVGVHPSIISIVASIQVSEAVKLLLGKTPSLRNTLLFCDLSDLSFERITLARMENCPVCGSQPRSQPSPIVHKPFQEICGREGRRVFVFEPDGGVNIDLKALYRSLEGQGFNVDVKAKMGTSFSRGPVKGSILMSGVMILEGFNSSDDAVRLHDTLIKS
jgi:molybdopterin/thiamine biosynthesis adenylyltransferase